MGCLLDRLPRIDYNPGAGGGAVEAALYQLSLPSLAYTPVFTSGLPPTGEPAASPQQSGFRVIIEGGGATTCSEAPSVPAAPS
jgi:hypothetical protein